MPLDLDIVREARVNRAAADHRAATLTTRRSVKRAWQAGWLLRAVTLIDLTTLAGDDTGGRVRRLCGKARRPVRGDILEALGVPPRDIKRGPRPAFYWIGPRARERCGASPRPVAVVSTGFPAGLSPAHRLLEIEERSRPAPKEVTW